MTQDAKDPYVKVCPKCKSVDVRVEKSNKLTDPMGMPQLFICNQCNYSGFIFPEVKLSELEDFEQEAEIKGAKQSPTDKSPQIDLSYGNNEVRVVWKIIGPLSLIAGFFMLGLQNFWGAGALILTGAIMSYVGFLVHFRLRQ